MYLHIYVCICINKIIVLNEEISMNWDQVEKQSSLLVLVTPSRE